MSDKTKTEPENIIEKNNIRDIIVSNAKKYIGIKEIPPNLGFDNPEFEKAMKSVGWHKGWAWCTSFVRYVWIESFKQHGDWEIIDDLKNLISLNSIALIHNFEEVPIFSVRLALYEPGDIAVWRTGRTSGHVGIVTKVLDGENKFETIEGNSSDSVKKNIRENKSFPNFELLGFVSPIYLEQ